MPSRVVTKRRVKRRQQRLVSKNAKRNARSVRKYRKSAKSVKSAKSANKVMRGGVGGGVAAMNSMSRIYSSGTSGTGVSRGAVSYKGRDEYMPEITTVYDCVYVLYDSIPLNKYENNKEPVEKGIINVPICAIFIAPRSLGIKDIYLFFNKNASASDIIMVVKLLLGFQPNDEFTLTPSIDITPPAPTPKWYTSEVTHPLQRFLGNTLVKLTACGLAKGGVNTYCIETGTFDGATILTEMVTTRHTITSTDKRYESINTDKIKKFLNDQGEGGFRALASTTVLPDLYKRYFVLYDGSPETQTVDETDVEKLFGEDIEPDKPDWDLDLRHPKEDWTSDSYPNFRKEWMDYIRLVIRSKNTHSIYGLRGTEADQVKTRPLNITDSKPAEYIELEAQQLIQSISNAAARLNSIFFTELPEDWVLKKEENIYENSRAYVNNKKKARVDGCVEHPNNPNYCDTASID